jgi:hypothetical protein
VARRPAGMGHRRGRVPKAVGIAVRCGRHRQHDQVRRGAGAAPRSVICPVSMLRGRPPPPPRPRLTVCCADAEWPASLFSNDRGKHRRGKHHPREHMVPGAPRGARRSGSCRFWDRGKNRRRHLSRIRHDSQTSADTLKPVIYHQPNSHHCDVRGVLRTAGIARHRSCNEPI